MSHLETHPTGPLTAQFPPTISFGSGKRQELPNFLAQWGVRKVAIIAAEACRPSVEEMEEAIGEKGITARAVYCLPTEPKIEDFVRICQQLGSMDPEAVIGIGGGSVLDIAKLVAALRDRPQRLREYIGSGLVSPRTRKLVCLPTTSGAGSEGSPNAIMVDELDHQKKAVISPCLIPDLVLIDPELTLSLPPHVTAATGFDALCHCIEAFANRNAHALIDTFALQGISLISSNIVRATLEGSDISARRAMALGSFLGGVCLGPVNTAAVHALSYPLGSAFGLPHGLANAILLPHVLRYNLPAMPDRYARIALAMGIPSGEDDLATGEAGILHLESLIEGCSLQDSLQHFEIDPSRFPELADQALQITRLLKNNPREVDHQAALSIYNNAFKRS